jgi:ribonuclease G
MTDPKFSRRRRGGQRFRPKGGLHQPQPTDRAAATEARTGVVSGHGGDEAVYDKRRHEPEIVRAENTAHDLPTEGAAEHDRPAAKSDQGRRDRTFREPTSAESTPTDAKPAEKPQGLIDTLKAAAQKVVEKVKRLVQPEKRIRKEVIINAESLETRVAVLEESKLEEFTIERTSEERIVHSIFKGRVKNLEDRLEAAFVDIGFEKNAFLHYWDIVPSNLDSGVEIVERAGSKKREKPRVTKKDIPRLYPPGSDIIIQVTKGPIGTKGPRVTTHLALPGRYLVLLPNSDQSGVSRKIEDPEERRRLKDIVRNLTLPDGMGVIIRTAGEGQQARYFVRDVAMLVEEWTRIKERIDKQPSATCVFQEPDLIERTVRDFLTEDVDSIIIDNPKECERMRELVGQISRRSKNKVRLYNEAQPVFDRYNVTRQLEMAFSRKATLKSGGYLVIDETEALVAIDVNTGSHKGGKDQESTILKVNLEAAEEICRQLRLRNMGGLIVLDFIDMRHGRDRQQVYQRMKDGLRRDKAKTHILPISQLGLMEMTRQRHSESVSAALYDDCSYCKGHGKVKSTLSMSVEIQRKLAEVMKNIRGRQERDLDLQLRIVVNPVVLDRLRKEDEKLLIEMEKKFFGKLSFRAEPAFHPEQFKIVNASTNEDLASVGF